MNKYFGADLQSSITNNSFLKHFSTGKYPGEFHLRSLNPFNKTNVKHNFTGPGSHIDKRLVNYNEIMNNFNETGDLNIDPIPTSDSIPINRIDQAAMKHDFFMNLFLIFCFIISFFINII